MRPDEYGLPPAVVRMRERRRQQFALARAAAERDFRAAVAEMDAQARAEHQRWVREMIPAFAGGARQDALRALQPGDLGVLTA